MALGVPEGSPLFAVSALVNLTSSTAISIRLIAVCTIVMEAGIMRAVLPAHWANPTVAFLTIRVAKGTIFLLVLRAGRKRLASSAARGLFPARMRHISVMIVVMIVMDRGTIIVLFRVCKGLLRIVSEVWHALIKHRMVMIAVGLLVVAMEATVMLWVVVEMMLSIIMIIMTVSKFILFHLVMISIMMIKIVAVMQIVVLLV